MYVPSIYVRMYANPSNDRPVVPPRPMDGRRSDDGRTTVGRTDMKNLVVYIFLSCQCTKTSVYSDAFVHLQ